MCRWLFHFESPEFLYVRASASCSIIGYRLEIMISITKPYKKYLLIILKVYQKIQGIYLHTQQQLSKTYFFFISSLTSLAYALVFASLNCKKIILNRLQSKGKLSSCGRQQCSSESYSPLMIPIDAVIFRLNLTLCVALSVYVKLR